MSRYISFALGIALMNLPLSRVAEAIELKLDRHEQRAHDLIKQHHYGNNKGKTFALFVKGPSAVKEKLRDMVASKLPGSVAADYLKLKAEVEKASLRSLVHMLEAPAVFEHVRGHDTLAIATPARGAVKQMASSKKLKTKLKVVALGLRAQDAGLEVLEGSQYVRSEVREGEMARRLALTVVGKELGLISQDAQVDSSVRSHELHNQLREAWFAKVDAAIGESLQGQRLVQLAAQAASATTGPSSTGVAIHTLVSGVQLERKLNYPLGNPLAKGQSAPFAIDVFDPSASPSGVIPARIADNRQAWGALKMDLSRNPAFWRAGAYAGALEQFEATHFDPARVE